MKRKTLADCQHDAVVLAQMVKAIDLMAMQGPDFDSPRAAITEVAAERAETLAADLDKLETSKAVAA